MLLYKAVDKYWDEDELVYCSAWAFGGLCLTYHMGHWTDAVDGTYIFLSRNAADANCHGTVVLEVEVEDVMDSEQFLQLCTNGFYPDPTRLYASQVIKWWNGDFLPLNESNGFYARNSEEVAPLVFAKRVKPIRIVTDTNELGLGSWEVHT